MKKLLILTLALLATVAGAIPAGAATAAIGGGGGGGGGGGPADGYAVAAGAGAQAGEIALGSFVAPTRAAAGRHGAATGLMGNPTCKNQCITSGVAYGRGPDARLVVTTDTSATIRIVVSGPAGYTRQIISGAGLKSFSADFDDLTADTHYDAVAIATDANGDTAVRSGSFRTLERNATVLYNEAHVSDNPYGGEVFTAQSWFEGVGAAPYAAGALTGGELTLGAQVLQDHDTDRFLSVGLELVESDLDVDEPCEVVELPDEPEVGDGDCTYAATAWLADGALDLDARPGSATDVNSYFIAGTMVLPNVDDGALPGGYGSPLDFTVPLAVHVTWTT